MAGETSPATAVSRRGIIKRPRLTRMLDESGARIILLVAPAAMISVWPCGSIAWLDAAGGQAHAAERAGHGVGGLDHQMRGMGLDRHVFFCRLARADAQSEHDIAEQHLAIVRILVDRVEQAYRERDLERLQSQADSGDLHALKIVERHLFGLAPSGYHLVNVLLHAATAVLLFAFIGIMWANHHRLFTIIQRADSGFLFINGLLLLVVTTIPFPTALLAEFFEKPSAPVACAIVAAIFTYMIANGSRSERAGKLAPMASSSTESAAPKRIESASASAFARTRFLANRQIECIRAPSTART